MKNLSVRIIVRMKIQVFHMKKMISGIWLGLLLSAFGISSIHAEEIVVHDTLVYRSVDGVNLQVHRFQLSHRSLESAPAIIFFFGGGWVRGHPKQFFPHAEHLAKQGMVAFSAEYRVRQRHGTTPFDAVEDGMAAIQWLRENAEQLNIDPERIVAAGGSAGGHVAACTGTITHLIDSTLDSEISYLPNAMILFNPVIDTGPDGYGYDRLQERYREISPVDHVSASTPPTLIFHGTADSTVVFENVLAFQDSMRASGNRCDVMTFEDKAHGFFNYGRDDNIPYEKTVAKTDSFLIDLGFLNY
jgi:acetyl esterase/lipase